MPSSAARIALRRIGPGATGALMEALAKAPEKYEADAKPFRTPQPSLLKLFLEFDLDPVHGSYKLWFDGTLVAQRSEFAFANPGSGKLRITLGMHSVNPPTPAFDVRYDNVVVDLQ